LAVRENLGEVNSSSAVGHFSSLPEGPNHAAAGAAGDFLLVVTLEGGLGQDDLLERGPEDLQDLSPVALMGANVALSPTPNFCQRWMRTR
jgi:hypothetical protein